MESSLPKRPRFLSPVAGHRSGVPERATFGGPRPDLGAPRAAFPMSQFDEPAQLAPAASKEELELIRRDAMEKLNNAIEMLRLQSERLAEQARSDAIEIAFAVARRILEGELKSSPEALFSVVRSAIRRAGESRQITVRLSAQDLAIIEGTKGRGSLSEVTAARVEVLADPNLQPGDCVVDADFGKVDGRISTRLEELRRAIDAAVSEGK